MKTRTFPTFVLLSFCVVVFGALGRSSYGQEKRKAPAAEDLLALEVIPSDQFNAQRTLGRYDRNGDDRLDAAEMRELGWADAPAQFDVNKDGRLTQLEVAIQFAYRRTEFGVTKVDQSAAGRFIQRHDKNDDRELDEEEMRAGNWPADPENFDTDKNGRLTPFEIAVRFAHNRRERLKKGVEPIDHSYSITTMNIYDRNGDRRLDAEELQAARTTALGAKLPMGPEEFDENRDGKLTINEIANGLSGDRKKRGVTAVDQKSAQNFVGRYDKNGDGELDAEEMLAGGWPKDPTEFDADKNGRLTIAEIATQFAKSKAQRGITDADLQNAGRLVLLYDRNNNNLIEVSEVIEAQRASAPQQPDDVRNVPLTILAFVHFDEDHDQRLSKAEISTLLAQRRKELEDQSKTTAEAGKADKE
jgi:Ca2+-binding EF-hand superfamily protein